MDYILAGALFLVLMIFIYWLWSIDQTVISLQDRLIEYQRDVLRLNLDLDSAQEHSALLREQLAIHHRRIMVLRKVVFPAKLTLKQKESIKLMGETVRGFDQ